MSSDSSTPPYVDCIQWVPRRFAGGQSPVTIADLVFTQAALKAVRDVAETRPDTSVFGVLLGEVREDPTCARRWVRVNRVVHGPAILGDPSASSLAEIRNSLVDGLDDDRPVVGWYRSHPGAGLYLSPQEAEFHEACFADPWGFAMILVADAGRLTGSVFQRTDPEGLSRSVYTPFYELVDDSSEFNGTTKRTYIGWPNYQTETRVVQAGQGSVSATIPDGAKALVDAPAPAPEPPAEQPATPAAPAAPAAQTDNPAPAAAPAPEPVVAEQTDAAAEAPAAADPTGSAPGAPDEDASPDIEDDWEKKQIQRSLTAVGRSLGSAGLGELGTPVQVDRDTRPEAEATDVGEHAEVEEAAPTADAARHEPVVIPIHRGSEAGGDGLVGRSRRQSNLPIKKIASAAAGFILLGTAGWVGSKMIDVPATDDEPTTTSSSTSAGLSLAPTDLFAPEPGAALLDSALNDSAAAELDTSFVSIGPLGVEVPADSGAIEGGETIEDEGSAEETPDDAGAEEAEVVQTPPPSPPPAPQIVSAPEIAGFEMDSPEVSAFKNALDIFRLEVQRYEDVRVEFDAGNGVCNPLNLAARGVRESFARLESRFRPAAERFAGTELRAFEGARRQQAMIETHYSLTDCPVSPSGGG